MTYTYTIDSKALNSYPLGLAPGWVRWPPSPISAVTAPPSEQGRSALGRSRFSQSACRQPKPNQSVYAPPHRCQDYESTCISWRLAPSAKFRSMRSIARCCSLRSPILLLPLHLVFHGFRQPLDLVRLLNYIQRQDVLIRLVNVLL